MVEEKISITKRKLWRYVNKKIKRSIHHYHVFSIISILFDELLKDLIDGKSIKITNFGTLTLKNLPPRHYHDVNERKLKKAVPHRILRFILAPKLRDEICKYLDVDLTFKDN
jgi:nucleoid DNA-binding protein